MKHLRAVPIVLVGSACSAAAAMNSNSNNNIRGRHTVSRILDAGNEEDAGTTMHLVDHQEVSANHVTLGSLHLDHGEERIESPPFYDADLDGDEDKHWITNASPVDGITGMDQQDGDDEGLMMVQAMEDMDLDLNEFGDMRSGGDRVSAAVMPDDWDYTTEEPTAAPPSPSDGDVITGAAVEDLELNGYEEMRSSEIEVSAAVMPDEWDYTTDEPTAAPPPPPVPSDGDVIAGAAVKMAGKEATEEAEAEKTIAAFPCDTLGSDCTICLSRPECVYTSAGCSNQCLMDTWCHHSPGDKDGVKEICGRIDKAASDAEDCAGRTTDAGCSGCLSFNGEEDRASCIWYEDIQSCASTCEVYIGCGFEIVQVEACPVALDGTATTVAEGEGRVVDPEVTGHSEPLLDEEAGECKTEACFLASTAFMSAYVRCNNDELCIEKAFLCWQNPTLCDKDTSLDAPPTGTSLMETASIPAIEKAAATKKIANRKRKGKKLKRIRERRKNNKTKTRRKKMYWSKRRWKKQVPTPTDIKLRVDSDVVMGLKFDLQNLGLARAGSDIPVEMKLGSVGTSSLPSVKLVEYKEDAATVGGQARSTGNLDGFVLEHQVDGIVTVDTVEGARSHAFHKDVSAVPSPDSPDKFVPSPRSQDQDVPLPRSQDQDDIVDADRCRAATKSVMEHGGVILEMNNLLTSESKNVLEKEPCKSNPKGPKCRAILAKVEATVASSIETEKTLLEVATHEKGIFCSHGV